MAAVMRPDRGAASSAVCSAAGDKACSCACPSIAPVAGVKWPCNVALPVAIRVRLWWVRPLPFRWPFRGPVAAGVVVAVCSVASGTVQRLPS